jgi:hypothetical protein
MQKSTLLLLFFISTLSFAQTTDDKIIAVYGQQMYDQNVQSNAGLINYFRDYIENDGMSLQVYNPKYSNAPVLTQIPLRGKNESSISISEFMDAVNSSSFNPLIYDFLPRNEVQIFRLQGVNKVIVIKNQKQPN